MKQKLLSTGLMALLFFSLAFAQKDVKINYKGFSECKGVSKANVKQIKAADKVYFKTAEPQYLAALPLYLKAYPDESFAFDALDWRVAMCYLYSSNKPAAIDYLLKCDDRISRLYYFYLGKAYHFDGDFATAKAYYTKFLKQFLEADEKVFYKSLDTDALRFPVKSVISTLVASCDLALELRDDEVSTTLTNIGAINSERDETFPFLMPDGELVFTSNQYLRGKGRSNNYKVLTVDYNSGLVGDAPRLCEKYPKDDKDNLTALPYQEVMGDSLLYQSMLTNKGDLMYVRPKKRKVVGASFPKINSSSQEGMACYLDKNTLVFSSNRDSKDDNSDLYMSRKNADGKWEKPIALAGDINTTADEEVVNYSDGVLYFVSDESSRSLGGYDIFRVPYLGNQQWGPVENLGYPINTADNDMGYYPISSEEGLYFGVRPENLGGLDIYKVTRTKVMREAAEKPAPKAPEVSDKTLDSYKLTRAEYEAMLGEVRDSLNAESRQRDSVLILDSDKVPVIAVPNEVPSPSHPIED